MNRVSPFAAISLIAWLIFLVEPLALLFAPSADSATYPPNELEIQASLSGYNLLWPSQRCCAYKLHIYPNDRESVVANISSTEILECIECETPSPEQFRRGDDSGAIAAVATLVVDIFPMVDFLRRNADARVTSYRTGGSGVQAIWDDMSSAVLGFSRD